MDTSKQSATELTNISKKFVSCIKIGGYRILPPLVNEKKRAEMRKYKEHAIEVEQKIKLRNTKKIKNKCKNKDRCSLYIESNSLSSSDSFVSSTNKSLIEDETLQSPIVFDDNTSADVLNMLKDFKIAKPRLTAAVKLPSLDTSAIKYVPLNANFESDNKYSDSNLPLKDADDTYVTNFQLTTKMVTRQDSYTVTNANQVFSDNVLKELTNTETNILADVLITDNKSESSTNNSISDKITSGATEPQHISRTDCIDHSDQSVSVSDSTNTENKENDSKCAPQKLIRSNSYILDTPSPLLLAQIQQNHAQNMEEVQTTEVRKRRSWDLASAREKWSSTDLNFITSPEYIDKQDKEHSDIGSGKTISNSLPASAAPSPNVEMFNSNTMKRSQSQKLKSKLPGKESTDHLLTQKTNVRSVLKTPEFQRKFVESFVTPMRNLKQDCELERKKLIYSEEKQKKLFNTFVKKTENISLRRPRTLALVKQKQVVNDFSSSITSSTTSNSKTPTKTDTCMLPKPPEVYTETNNRIREIIDKIQSEQLKQMSELIERQRQEQKKLMKVFAAQQALLVTTLKNNHQTDISPNSPNDLQAVECEGGNTSVIIIDNHAATEYNASGTLGMDVLKNTENVMVECKKLLCSNSFTEPLSNPSYTTVSSPDDTLADLTIRSEQNDSYSPHGEHLNTYVQNQKGILTHSASVPHRIVSESSKFSRSFSDDSLEPTTHAFQSAKKNIERSRNSPCNKQLFSTEKQIWAANKICAATRGYLTRRLIRTERVQNLILTIKDALLCAMELHHETVENIRPSDVEFHRRLIQQVTSACYTFHEMFFGLSKAEQMSVIAADRERLWEKAMRPASARSSSSITSTTQRVLERKMRRASNDYTSAVPSRSSSSRSCHSVSESRTRTKSLGLSDSLNSTKKTSPQNDVMRRAMSYGASKKPWR